MPSAPSRFEVEHLHRLMLRASVEAAQLDARLDQARNDDGLWPALHHWYEAAKSLDEAVGQARPQLEQDGTPREQIDRIRARLGSLEQRSQQLDLDFDLDPCVEAWTSVGHELAQLSGRRRDPLMRLLEHRKPAIDRTTAMLSEAQRHEGLLREQHRKVLELQKERDRAREKYERLRQAWLAAQEHLVEKPPVPDLRRLAHERPGPVLVRLPLSTPAARAFAATPAPPPLTLPFPAPGPALRQPPARPRPFPGTRSGADLPQLLERDHRHRDRVAARLETTLSHLATAPHRTLTDSTSGEVRAHLARMDAILARLRGATRQELLDGAQAIGSILRRIDSIPAPGGNGAEIRKLIEERRTQLHRIAQAQLAAELPKRTAAGLGALSQKPQAVSGALGTTAVLAGGLHALRGPHPAAGLQPPSSGTALRELAAKAELKQKQLAARAPKGPMPAQTTAGALLGALKEHPKATGFAAHLAPGGALRALCETMQRGHGLPIGQAAQHYLASRGSSHVWNAVTTFQGLVKQGHRPRFSLGSWLTKNVSDQVSHALHGVSQTVSRARDTGAGLAGATRQGISSFSNRAMDMELRASAQVGRAVARGATSLTRSGLQAAQQVGRSAFGLVRHSGNALAHVAAGGFHAAQGAATWAQRKAGGASHWLGETVHSGLEWTRKTGVVGAVGTGLRKGLSFLKTAAEHTPLGHAVQKGYGFVKAGGLGKVWNTTQHLADNALAGLKTAYNTTSKFLQSPAGQLLVTGLSLAASFIPGGILVKAVIGAGIGAMQAISEGKDWKSVLASAAGGALTGAIPFLKIGPLAKIGVGALQGGITALASGGSLKDALKGAAGGALDSFDPGAFHALKKMKSFRAAEKLLHGKVMANPRARQTIGALEKLYSKGVKGGILVSGKAARAQHALDKVVRAGDQIHGVLSEVHELAPGLADALGDNAAGQFVGRLGDWAGRGDDRLQKALGYGHAASHSLSKSRGYLHEALGHAGVKDPAKAYEKMTARGDLRAGKKGALEHVARLKLEDHLRKHPELRLAEATRRRSHPRPERTALEKAVTRGRDLVRKGRRVAQDVHDGLGKVHHVVEKGLGGAGKVQSGLEKAIAVARQGAQMLGEDSDAGRSLTGIVDRAERIHDHLQTGIGVAEEFNRKVGATHDAIEKIPGIHKEGEAEPATHLEGRHRPKKSPHDANSPKAAGDKRPGGPVQHGLAGIEKYRKKAIKAGKRIDSGLTTAERALNKGIGVGKKVDSGLEKVASFAERVSRILGEDSALGELAHQVGEGAGKGHEKLHQALHMAQSGKKFLHTGHEIFHRALEAAQGHHARQIEKAHGKRPAHAGHTGGEHVLHHAASEHVLHQEQHGGHDAVVDPARAVQNALQWVTAFGKQIAAAMKQIEKLMHAGRTKEAADRVRELRAMSDQTRAEVERAVKAAANDPQLAKQAASARKHELELRAHLTQFVKGLHGLDAAPDPAAERHRGRGHSPSGRGRAHRDPVGELIDGILDGDDGRIHVDRGAARGDVAVHDLQEVDSAALETWLGSGESVKLFSEVFGGFIPAEGGMVVHHRRGRPGGHPEAHRPQAKPSHRRGFFARLVDRVEGFADRIAGWARNGSTLLGKGMHYTEMGMHGLSQAESAAEKVQGYAGQTERFLEKMGLHTLAGYAGKIGGAAGWVDGEAKAAHGGLKKADHWMGEGKSALGKLGGLANAFKASKTGDGLDGELSPQKVALGSTFDEPRRLDVTTLSKMQSFLGGDFSGVRVHTGPGAAEVTRRFNAEAVTVKDHIFFAPGRFNPATVEGQRLIAHELTHVLQKGRANLDVRTAEGEALHSEHSYGRGPQMETLNLRRPEPGFRLASDGEGAGAPSGIHTAKRTRSRGHEAGGKDAMPDGDELLEQISGRVYDLLMEELENAFESR